jgi:NADH dehydrogenase
VAVDRAGRALVLPDLTVPGHPNVFIIGDAAAVAIQRGGATVADGPGTPKYVPGLAAAANQMGIYAARAIVSRLKNETPRPFRYRNRGALAVIGRNRAVADFGNVRLTGRSAFLTWLLVHLLYLAGFRNRVSVALEWLYAYFTYRPGARLITGDGTAGEAASERRHEALRTSA